MLYCSHDPLHTNPVRAAPAQVVQLQLASMAYSAQAQAALRYIADLQASPCGRSLLSDSYIPYCPPVSAEAALPGMLCVPGMCVLLRPSLACCCHVAQQVLEIL
jgi:hypothetical protein